MVHEPLKKSNCQACHHPHVSDQANNLLKKEPMLCLTCHRDIGQYWREGIAHKPALHGCTTCHNAHSSDHQSILKKTAGSLCADCHDSSTQRFLTVHMNIKPGKDSCLGCHDPHGSPEKGLLLPISHTPFSEGNCRPCHPGEGR